MSQLKKLVIQEKIFAQHVRCANPFAGALCVCWREWVMSATKQRNYDKSGDVDHDIDDDGRDDDNNGGGPTSPKVQGYCCHMR